MPVDTLSLWRTVKTTSPDAYGQAPGIGLYTDTVTVAVVF
jgi:hypothetical protein